MTRIAAIDCGTNTIKLLIGDLPDVDVREARMVRLGQGVDTTGALADEALDRAFAAIDHFATLISDHDVSRIRFCATSATRDASNGDVFAAGVHVRLGVWPEVISGAEEAALSYDGAIRNLRVPPEDPTLVIDIGGGSTELIIGSGSALAEARSLDIGSVRLHERHLHSDPPSSEEIAACVADIDAQLDRLTAPGTTGPCVDLASARTVVGVAGTCATVAAGVLDLPEFSVEAYDQRSHSVADTLSYIDRLTALSVAERRSLGYMHPGRADVIGAGSLILGQVLRRTSAERWISSEADILDGIAWSIS